LTILFAISDAWPTLAALPRLEKLENVDDPQNDSQTNAPTSINGPVLGYVYDSEQAAILPVLGEVGSSLLGKPISLPFPLSRATIAPVKDYALVSTSGHNGLQLLVLNQRQAFLRDIPGLLAEVDQAIFSMRGDAALVFSSVGQAAQVVTGLPENPTVIATFPGIGGQARALSDDASAMLITVNEGQAISLYVLTLDGDSRWLRNLDGLGPISFLSNSHDAVIGDAVGHSVFLIQDVTGNAAIRMLATQAEGIAQPIAVAASPDNRRIFIADAESKKITAIDLASGLSNIVACEQIPSALHSMSGGGVFRLVDVSGSPLWLLDARDESFSLSFVPVHHSRSSLSQTRMETLRGRIRERQAPKESASQGSQ
jgi:hypothetical protein